MENASKALLMAASMLIGLLILTLAVYLFATFGAQASQIRKENEIQQKRQFNEQFTIYEQQSGNVTIYDVVTAANVAKDNNEYYGFISKNSSGKYIDLYNSTKDGKDNYISVYLDSSSIENNDDTTSFIKNNMESKYNCKVDISSTTGRVYKVTFTNP